MSLPEIRRGVFVRYQQDRKDGVGRGREYREGRGREVLAGMDGE